MHQANEAATKRRRGVLLTSSGMQKLTRSRQEYEFRHNAARRLTLEQLSELTRLNTSTLTRIHQRRSAIDRSSLVQLFEAFGLTLGETDYLLVDPAVRERRYPTTQRHSDAAHIPALSGPFVGRGEELNLLERWVVAERCRMVLLTGLAGTGKTALALTFAQLMRNRFEVILHQSLAGAPPLAEVLDALLEGLGKPYDTARDTPGRIRQLLASLQSRRVLLLFDDAEHLHDPAAAGGVYRPECRDWAEFFDRIADTAHDSCLLLLSRERPRELARLTGPTLSVRSLGLEGLSAAETTELMGLFGDFIGTEADWLAVCRHFGGNPRLLQNAAVILKEVIDGDIGLLVRLMADGEALLEATRALLGEQLERLSAEEREVSDWLALAEQGWTLVDLVGRLRTLNPAHLVEVLTSLSYRSLLVREGATFSLPVVARRYYRWQLVDRLAEQLQAGELRLLDSIQLACAPGLDGALLCRMGRQFFGATTLRTHLEQLQAQARQLRPSGYALDNLDYLLQKLPAERCRAGRVAWLSDFQQARHV